VAAQLQRLSSEHMGERAHLAPLVCPKLTTSCLLNTNSIWARLSGTFRSGGVSVFMCAEWADFWPPLCGQSSGREREWALSGCGGQAAEDELRRTSCGRSASSQSAAL